MSDEPEGIRKLLLGPLILLIELVGAVIPGTLFVLLLVVKRLPEAIAFVGTDLIGYRMKIACGLLISYVFGKALLMPTSLLQSRLALPRGELNLFDAKKTGNFWEKLNPNAKAFLGGAFASGFLKGSTPWEHMSVALSEVSFRLSTGLALILASFIPGDGRLRLVEGCFGVYFLGLGIYQARKMQELTFALLGTVTIETLLASTEEQRNLIFPLVNSILATHIASGDEKSTAQPLGAAEAGNQQQQLSSTANQGAVSTSKSSS